MDRGDCGDSVSIAGPSQSVWVEFVNAIGIFNKGDAAGNVGWVSLTRHVHEVAACAAAGQEKVQGVRERSEVRIRGVAVDSSGEGRCIVHPENHIAVFEELRESEHRGDNSQQLTLINLSLKVAPMANYPIQDVGRDETAADVSFAGCGVS